MLEALLGVATRVLALSPTSLRRRDVQNELVCAFGRVHAKHGVTARAFCAALALPARTFRSWQHRPAKPAAPPAPPKPPNPPNDRNTGRFALEATAPDTQLGGDTTDLCVLGVGLKLVGVQDIGDRERCLFDAFAVDHRESQDLIVRAVTDACAGREGMQLITDQGTPYLAEAAAQAYAALGLEHAPQREGTPTAKATVERGFGTVKQALAPVCDVLNRIATAVPATRNGRSPSRRTTGTPPVPDRPGLDLPCCAGGGPIVDLEYGIELQPDRGHDHHVDGPRLGLPRGPGSTCPHGLKRSVAPAHDDVEPDVGRSVHAQPGGWNVDPRKSGLGKSGRELARSPPWDAHSKRLRFSAGGGAHDIRISR